MDGEKNSPCAAGRKRCVSGPSWLTQRESGFTFLELAIVLVLLGILFSFTIPNITILPGKYRLRSAARVLASEVENLRLTAVSRGTWLGIHYRIDVDESYYQIIPPPPDDFPDQPVEDRKRLAKNKFPPGVRLLEVRLRGGRAIGSGTVDILFSPTGVTGSHSVTLATKDDRLLTMRFNAITGTVDFYDTEPKDFEDFEG